MIFDLLGVVSLPSGVFKPYTGVKTAVLVFRKPVDIDSNRVKQVWFYEVKNDGFDPDKITGAGRAETPELNDIPLLLKLWEEYKHSNFKKPPGIEAGTLLKAGSDDPKFWWASLDKIAENDYNLAAGRYKPQVTETVPDDDPIELIEAVLGIEREIVTGLEKLLGEIKE